MQARASSDSRIGRAQRVDGGLLMDELAGRQAFELRLARLMDRLRAATEVPRTGARTRRRD